MPSNNKDKTEIVKDSFVLGHRERVKKRFLNSYNTNMEYDEVNLLELILFFSIPRKDVKPLANQLLKKYGSIASILSTSKESLLHNKGITENTIVLLYLLKSTNTHLLKRNIINKHILKHWNDILDYCFAKLAYEKKELLSIIYLNSKSKIIKDEVIQEGSINEIVAHPREILKRCLDLSATSIIIVHNHPSGDSEPSSEDISMTYALKNTLMSANIELKDHIIIAESGVITFKNLGLLK